MKCKSIKSDGKQCEAFAQKDKDFCFRHDPDQIPHALEASQRGGSNRQLKGLYGEPVVLETPADIKRFLSKVINAVWAEDVPVPVGSSMGFLTRCWLDAHEKSDMETRLDEIEKALEEIKT